MLSASFASANVLSSGWNFLITGYDVVEESPAPSGDTGTSPVPSDTIAPQPSVSQPVADQQPQQPDQSQQPQQFQDQNQCQPDQPCFQNQPSQSQEGQRFQQQDQSQQPQQFQDQREFNQGQEQLMQFNQQRQQQRQNCPSEDQINQMISGCNQHGGNWIRNTDPSGCTFIDCSFSGGSQQGQFQGAPQFNQQGQFAQQPAPTCRINGVETPGACSNFGGGQQGQFQGAPQFGQQDPFSGQACQSKEEADQQAQTCAQIGAQPIASPGQNGCAPIITCSQSGKGGLSYDQYQQGQQAFESGQIDSVQVLEAILKMDSLKIQISNTQKQMQDIANYYESQGDSASAASYNNAADILSQVASKIDEQKQVLKDAVSAGTLDYETIFQIRSDLQYSVDELMNQVISALLGVEYTGISGQAGELECGSNGLCFQNDFRECAAGATFSPESGISITISGVGSDDSCGLQVSGPFGQATCNVPNYRFAQLSKEAIMPYCEGLPDMSQGQDQNPSENFQEQDSFQQQAEGVEPVEPVEPIQPVEPAPQPAESISQEPTSTPAPEETTQGGA